MRARQRWRTDRHVAADGIEFKIVADIYELKIPAHAGHADVPHRLLTFRRQLAFCNDIATHGSGFEVAAPDLRADIAAHRLQTLHTVHRFDDLIGADRVNGEPAFAGYVHDEIAVIGVAASRQY